LREDQFTDLVITRSQFLRTRNVSDEGCRGNQTTHFMFNDPFFFNRAAMRCHFIDTLHVLFGRWFL